MHVKEEFSFCSDVHIPAGTYFVKTHSIALLQMSIHKSIYVYIHI